MKNVLSGTLYLFFKLGKPRKRFRVLLGSFFALSKHKVK